MNQNTQPTTQTFNSISYPPVNTQYPYAFTGQDYANISQNQYTNTQLPLAQEQHNPQSPQTQTQLSPKKNELTDESILSEIEKDSAYINQQKCVCGKIMSFPKMTHNIGKCVARLIAQDSNATTVRERYLNREIKDSKKQKNKNRDRCKYVADLLNSRHQGSCCEEDICCVCSMHIIKPGNLPCCNSNLCRDKFRNATNYQRKKGVSSSRDNPSISSPERSASFDIGNQEPTAPRKGRPRIIDTMRILKNNTNTHDNQQLNNITKTPNTNVMGVNVSQTPTSMSSIANTIQVPQINQQPSVNPLGTMVNSQQQPQLLPNTISPMCVGNFVQRQQMENQVVQILKNENNN